MPQWIAQQLVLALAQRGQFIVNLASLFLGLVSRRTAVILVTPRSSISSTHLLHGMCIDIVDPWVDIAEVKSVYDLDVHSILPSKLAYDLVILCVAHQQFISYSHDQWTRLTKNDGILFDLKGIIPRDLKPLRL